MQHTVVKHLANARTFAVAPPFVVTRSRSVNNIFSRVLRQHPNQGRQGGAPRKHSFSYTPASPCAERVLEGHSRLGPRALA
jgi:hypothetical protein